jgi:hypothetical protein
MTTTTPCDNLDDDLIYIKITDPNRARSPLRCIIPTAWGVMSVMSEYRTGAKVEAECTVSNRLLPGLVRRCYGIHFSGQ